MNFEWTAITAALPELLQGLELTIAIALAGLVGGTVLGILTGIALNYGGWLAQAPAQTYVALIRGTPIMVQVMFIYFALPIMMGIRISATNAGDHHADHQFGRLQRRNRAWRAGQRAHWPREAGLAMGLSFRKVLAYVIAPIAFRRALPAMGNQLVAVVKDTSIFLVIGVGELTRRGQEIMSAELPGRGDLDRRGADLPDRDQHAALQPAICRTEIAPAMSMIEFRQVTKRFGAHLVLHPLDLAIEQRRGGGGRSVPRAPANRPCFAASTCSKRSASGDLPRRWYQRAGIVARHQAYPARSRHGLPAVQPVPASDGACRT